VSPRLHQRAEALRAGHVQIKQQQLDVQLRFQCCKERRHAVGFENANARERARDRTLEGLAKQRMVIRDDNDLGHRLYNAISSREAFDRRRPRQSMKLNG
jgi:hypothetical protein